MKTSKRNRFFITGGAGFIGSNLVDRLLERGDEVVVFDNLTTGREAFLSEANKSSSFHLVRGDILDRDALNSAMKDCSFVFHFSANADVRFGTSHPERDLQQNTIGTFNVLEAMRLNSVEKIAFSSTGSVYGEASIIPTPEDHPFPIQTSLYGASKLAGEGLIQAYSEGFGIQSWIFRFVSILGERYTHGHVFDFFRALRQNPLELQILGDGHQKKSYLYIQDCIDAIFCAIDKADGLVNVFNLGTEDFCEVNQSVEWITQQLNLKPRLIYTGGQRGWIGDNPIILLDTSSIRSLGWRPRKTIEQAVKKTLSYLQENEDLVGVK